MILRALHSRGILDISSQETHYDRGAANLDHIQFRLSLKPNQTVEVKNEFIRLKNIDQAINAGLLEVLSYDNNLDASVTQAQLAAIITGGGVLVGSGGVGVVDSVPLSTAVTNKWLVSVDDGTNGTTFSCEIFAHYDGSAISYTTYAKLGTCSVTLSVDVSSGSMRLLATATEDDQTVKSERITVAGA